MQLLTKFVGYNIFDDRSRIGYLPVRVKPQPVTMRSVGTAEARDLGCRYNYRATCTRTCTPIAALRGGEVNAGADAAGSAAEGTAAGVGGGGSADDEEEGVDRGVREERKRGRRRRGGR